VSITATIVPASLEDMIRQRVQAREISQEAYKTQPAVKAGFGIKLWTNKETNYFVEDDRLIIYIQSDRDAYLKLDYFQADGTVVHLVPNIYRGQSFIHGGTVYAFGDVSGPDEYVIQGPYGDETIKAIASTEPIELSDDSSERVSESRSYLKTLKSKLRGIRVAPATTAVTLKTGSKRVEEYKQALKTLQ
jgi:hypothetical protein